jgi:drug/metabolite transporter superfamily protein YnfA
MSLAHSVQYLEYQWERTYPMVLGLVSAMLIIALGERIFELCAQHSIHLENSYAAVAGVFAIIAGFWPVSMEVSKPLRIPGCNA